VLGDLVVVEVAAARPAPPADASGRFVDLRGDTGLAEAIGACEPSETRADDHDAPGALRRSRQGTEGRCASRRGGEGAGLTQESPPRRPALVEHLRGRDAPLVRFGNDRQRASDLLDERRACHCPTSRRRDAF
jgi:hypothetical protein